MGEQPPSQPSHEGVPAASRGSATVLPAESQVLSHALATTFTAGGNVRGAAPGAAWTFLLPTLELDAIVHLGLPSTATLTTLARLGSRVLVVCSERARPRALERARALGQTHVSLADGAAIAGERAIDLAVLGEHAPDEDVVAHALARATTVFVDDLDLATGAVPDGHELWLAPARGEPRRVAMADDARTISVLRSGDAGAARSRGMRARLRALVRRESGGSRRGLLSGAWSEPPEYVRAIAGRHGIDLARCRVGLSAPGEYATRKAVLLVFDGDDAPAPRWVVKLTRAPEQNARLENEWEALVRLGESGIGADDEVPRAAFSGRHAGLALVGESAVAGAPLRARTDATPTCPYATAAVRWLLEMGERSVAPEPAPGATGAALAELARRFYDLYDPPARQRAVLDELIARISAARVPTVFQHGDPGSWNILVNPEGRPVFLDWEAFEPRGVPLWDAFYLARSHAVTVARANGRGDALGAVRAAFIDEDGPAARALAELLDEHCARIGLERELALALFATCWMHRALKQAGRLRPGHLARGHYARLLSAVLERPNAPGLLRIAGTSPR